jgi:hypothetical protein
VYLLFELMLTKRSLRLLILADLVLIVAGAVVGMVGEAWLPEPLLAFEQARAEAEMETEDWVLLGSAIPLLQSIWCILHSLVPDLRIWSPASVGFLRHCGSTQVFFPEPRFLSFAP